SNPVSRSKAVNTRRETKQEMFSSSCQIVHDRMLGPKQRREASTTQCGLRFSPFYCPSGSLQARAFGHTYSGILPYCGGF
ncbi:MAG TPA: hypothetical protein VH593_25000, partial [Ktedonobacteraceae bacterium]